MPAVVISNLYRNLFGVSRSNALWLFIFLEELQMNIEKIKLAMFAAILTTGLTACEKPGPAEKAGKEIDQAMAEASSNTRKLTATNSLVLQARLGAAWPGWAGLGKVRHGLGSQADCDW